jgi:hypothetical protein
MSGVIPEHWVPARLTDSFVPFARLTSHAVDVIRRFGGSTS